MKPVAPRLEYEQLDVTEDQIEVASAKAMVYARFRLPDGNPVLVSRWRLSPEERDRVLLEGADVYLYEVGPARDLVLTVGPMPERAVLGDAAPPDSA